MLQEFTSNDNGAIYNTIIREGKRTSLLIEDNHSVEKWSFRERIYQFTFVGTLCTRVQFQIPN